MREVRSNNPYANATIGCDTCEGTTTPDRIQCKECDPRVYTYNRNNPTYSGKQDVQVSPTGRVFWTWETHEVRYVYEVGNRRIDQFTKLSVFDRFPANGGEFYSYIDVWDLARDEVGIKSFDDFMRLVRLDRYEWLNFIEETYND